MSNSYIWTSIAIVALVTAAIRFSPFVIFGGKRKVPETIERLGKMLPYAIMGMLVVFCLKSVSFSDLSGFVPEALACLVVGALYIWKRNTLLSIIAGTVCYMIMVQMIF